MTKKTHLRNTPPRRDAFKHSGGDSLLCTSATVTLYFDVELSKDNLPGTEQKMSTGVVANKRPSLLLGSRALIPAIVKMKIIYFKAYEFYFLDERVHSIFQNEVKL